MSEVQASRHQRKTMNRADLTRRLASQLKDDEAIVAGIGFANFDLWSVARRPQNFYMLGSMGLAFPIALGVALAQPQRKVVALEGDGSVLMQLGALTTIAAQRPKNLILVIWDNGAYQITGGQPATTATVADLVTMARGAGIEAANWAEDEAHFDALFANALRQDGPTLLAAKIDNQRPVATTHRDPVQIRERFMRGLGVRDDP